MSEFDNITDNTALVINLEHRVDRWYELTNNCGHLLDLQRINAVRESPGWIGCYKSHIKILREADNLNLDTVLVIEDDCVIRNGADFERRWPLIKQWLDTNLDKWDIFLGGNISQFYGSSIPQIVNRELNLVRMPTTYTTHFTYYNKTTYHQLLHQPMVNPIDWFPANFKVLVTYPYLAVQNPGYSDVDSAQNKSLMSDFNGSENQLRGFLASQ